MELRAYLSTLTVGWLGIAALSAAEPPGLEGVLRTGAGVTHQGTIRWSTNGVAVSRGGGPSVTVPLDQILELTFGDVPAEPAAEMLRTPNPPAPNAATTGWTGVAIGPGVTGRIEDDKEGWAVSGSGAGLRGNSDGFYFAQRRIETGGQILAQLRYFDGHQPEAMAGVMLRDNLGESAAYAFLGQRVAGGLCLQYRQIAGGMTMRLTNLVLNLPVWLRLGRQGGAITADASADGREWKSLGRVNVNLGQNARAGIAVMSGIETNSALARFAEPAVGAAGMGYAPARGYPRIVLRGGSTLISPVAFSDDAVLHLGGPLRGSLLSVLNVARIEYLPLTSDGESRLEPDRPGLLLADGDFLDGSLRGIGTNGVVTWNSLIFGFRRFAAGTEAAAIHLGMAEAEDAPYRVGLRNGSDLRARRLELISGAVRVESPLLGSLALPATQVKTIRRTGKEN